MSNALVEAASQLAEAVDRLTFNLPVACVYNPLRYAWEPHRAYLETYGAGRKKVALLGMNPGPFGMAQTGVPFGEISLVRDWMKLERSVSKPPQEHPKRPIEGFNCNRSEVSGRRLWGLFSDRFGEPEKFFADHFVLNYCPLVFMSETGANVTPDKLPAAEREPLFAACDEHLREAVAALEVDCVVGVGGFAEGRAKEALDGVAIHRILHPSPASPAANRDWSGTASRQLVELGLWTA